MARLRKERTARSIGHTKKPRSGPMRSGDPFGNHRQRAIRLALIFEAILAYEDGVGAAAPLPHQCRACFEHDAGSKGESALLRRCGEGLQSATQPEVGAAMGALLQIIGKASDEQTATNPDRRFGVMPLVPGKPQLLCRSIEQFGNLAVDLGDVRTSRPPALVAGAPRNGR